MEKGRGLLLATIILLGILTVVMAVHGGILASNDPRHRRWFKFYGFVGVLLVCIQGYYLHREDKDNRREQTELKSALKNLQNQTFALANALKLQATLDDFKRLETAITDGFDRLAALLGGKKLVTSPTAVQPLPPVVVQHIRIVQRRAASTNPQAQFGLQVVMQTDVTMQPVGFRVECDHEIADGNAFIVGQGAYMQFAAAFSDDRKSFLFSFHSPPFTPDSSLVVALQSKYDIKVTKVETVRPLF